MTEIGVMEVGGFRVGHAQDDGAATGCTVILFDRETPAGVSVQGGGPASRDTRILDPLMAAEGIHAILLSGGSAFGLDAAGGVMRYLEARGVGFPVAGAVVPLVCQSGLFDLNLGRPDIRPDAAMGEAACRNASYDAPAEGNVGAGAGCSVGKLLGMDRAVKTGFGTWAAAAGALRVGALVAVNALGDVYDGGERIAGVRDPLGRSSTELLLGGSGAASPGANTTIGAIVTNARLTKAQLCKAAAMAHDGFARAIRPVHTGLDGDSIYAASVGTVPADLNTVGVMAAYVMERAIVRAARSARAAHGLPGLAGK